MMFKTENSDTDIIVCGDIHGGWGYLNKLVNQRHPKIILQCGDFGYFPNLKYKKAPTPPKIPDGSILYWCDGNHDDHESLSLRKTDEIWPNVIYKPRGSTLTLPDGRVVLFMGGAVSIDKHLRTPYVTWWPEEVISYDDMNNLPDTHVDIIVSHTAPLEFEILQDGLRGNPNAVYFTDKKSDPCRTGLSHILEKYKPKHWYMGHWHFYNTGEDCGCKWTVLNMAGEPLWWQYLNR